MAEQKTDKTNYEFQSVWIKLVLSLTTATVIGLCIAVINLLVWQGEVSGNRWTAHDHAVFVTTLESRFNEKVDKGDVPPSWLLTKVEAIENAVNRNEQRLDDIHQDMAVLKSWIRQSAFPPEPK